MERSTTSGADDEPALFALKTPDGGGVIMDQATLAYLSSTQPDPNKEQLAALLRRVARVRILFSTDGDQAVEVRQASAIAALRRVLVIPEDAAAGHCMCHGDLRLELYEPGSSTPLASLGVHHGKSIRWAAWGDDARLADGEGLLRWVAEQGVPEPLRRFEVQQREEEQWARDWTRWRGACPPGLRPLLEDERAGIRDGFDASPEWLLDAEAVLEASFPGPMSRLLALFSWFGHGTKWDGYPTNEDLPRQLLERVPEAQLVEALGGPMTRAQLEGAARYFCRSGTRDAPLPDALRAAFVRYALASGDEERVIRAANTQLDRIGDVELRAPLAAQVRAFRTELARRRTPTVQSRRRRLFEIANELGKDLHPEDVEPELDPALLRCWACDCAERAVPWFEAAHPGDSSLRDALRSARRYATGEADVRELERAWGRVRDADEDLCMPALHAQDEDRQALAWRASAACSAVMEAAQVPARGPLDFSSAASSAEDAIVGGWPGGRPEPAKRLEERAWQARRLAERVREAARAMPPAPRRSGGG